MRAAERKTARPEMPDGPWLVEAPSGYCSVQTLVVFTAESASVLVL